MSKKYSVPIGNKLVGPDNPCFLVFEGGGTHTGLEPAKVLAQAASQAGADAIKFHFVYDPTRLNPDPNACLTYQCLVNKETGETKQVTEPVVDIVRRRTMPKEKWFELANYCRGLGLEVFFTISFPDDIDAIKEMGLNTVKICSGDMNHLPLIEYAAKSGLTIQLDTGSATMGEIDAAVETVLSAGNKNLILHHVPTGYPAQLDSINLRTIASLVSMYDFPIAFSDHSPGWDMDIAALTLGASMIEKTITVDRAFPSSEHIFSLEPHEATGFVNSIRLIETALGSGRHVLTAMQRKNRQIVQRSMYLLKDVKKGDSIKPDDFTYRRPGGGISPTNHEQIQSMVYGRDIKKDTKVHFKDLEWPNK